MPKSLFPQKFDPFLHLLKNPFLFVGIVIADAAMALGFVEPILQGHIQKPVST